MAKNEQRRSIAIEWVRASHNRSAGPARLAI
jgi:hypothetical protein